MEKTPLELYESAYKLHYIEKHTSEAIAIYEKLITEFPNSNECGYAAIQLQKIKTANILDEINENKSALHPLSMVAFLLSCLAILACGACVYYFKIQIKTEVKHRTVAVSALGKIISNTNDEALQLLSELKDMEKSSITPYELSAEIHKKNKRLDLAYKEYEMFFQRNPERHPTVSEVSAMEHIKLLIAQPNSKKSSSEKNSSDSSSFETKSTKSIDTVKPKAKIPEKKKSSEPKQSLSEKNNEHLVVDPDSISYF
jgi:tetratricopeptide (TPR) repeat protein